MKTEKTIILETKYISELVSKVRALPDEVKKNPGVDMPELDQADGFQPGRTWITSSGHHCIHTEKGTVIWGGDAAERLLASFDLLHVRPGYGLSGYYYFDGMGGNFIPVAIPVGRPLPPWLDIEHNPVFNSEFLSAGLEQNVESFITHSGVPESYFQRSIFLRELYSIGAWWHGCDSWSINGIITCRGDAEKHLLSFQRSGYNRKKISSFDIPETEIIHPRVIIGKDIIEVRFCVFTEGLGSNGGIFQICDTYRPDGQNVGESRRETLLDLGPGPIP